MMYDWLYQARAMNASSNCDSTAEEAHEISVLSELMVDQLPDNTRAEEKPVGEETDAGKQFHAA